MYFIAMHQKPHTLQGIPQYPHILDDTGFCGAVLEIRQVLLMGSPWVPPITSGSQVGNVTTSTSLLPCPGPDPPSLPIPQENPYVMRRPNFQALSGNERFEGFCVDMLRELAELLRFRYRLRLVEDGLYGAPEPNGSWTGMVGELINRVWPAGGEAGVSGPAGTHSRKGRKDTGPVGCFKWPTLL